MAWPFYINEVECIADGSCADICPKCFRYKAGKDATQVISFDCDEILVQKAMNNCPTRCLHWEDEE